MRQTMVELQVMFENPSIPNHVLLIEYESDLWGDLAELRQVAEEKLGVLEDAQCFYRFFHREVDE